MYNIPMLCIQCQSKICLQKNGMVYQRVLLLLAGKLKKNTSQSNKKQRKQEVGRGGRRSRGRRRRSSAVSQSVCPTAFVVYTSHDRPFHLLFIDVDRGHPGRRSFFDEVTVVLVVVLAAVAVEHFWHGTTTLYSSLSWNGKGWWCSVWCRVIEAYIAFEKSVARKSFFDAFRSNSSQMSTFNFQHFLCIEFPTFFGNARI